MSESKEALFRALTAYVDVLSKGTHYANDRPLFTNRLARAAEMFSAIHREDNAGLQVLVESEIRNHGWSYISSPEGEAVGAAWQVFASLARNDPNVA